MGTEQKRRRGADEPGIPEFAPTGRRDDDDDLSDSMEETAKGIVNTFTVERDTSLADGAGAPGSTAVGGMRKDRRDEA